MFAVLFREYGDPSVLSVGEAPEPHPGPGTIRIAVRTAAVNPFDWKVRAGYMKDMMPLTFPAIPGLEAAGVVDEVGEGVTDVRVGDSVFGLGRSTTAEFAVLSHWAAKPDSLSWEEAGGLAIAAETALRCLELVRLSSGQTLLVEGASGSVGSAAVQLAVADGLGVIGTASSSNQEYVRSLGAIPTTYGEGQGERVAGLAPQGVDGAIDTVGKGTLATLVSLTGSPEKVVTIADFSAPELGVHVSSKNSAFHALPRVARLASEGTFTVRIGSEYPLEDASKAHELSEGGHPGGKVITRVS